MIKVERQKELKTGNVYKMQRPGMLVQRILIN